MSETWLQLCGRIAVRWRGERVEDRLPARQGRLLLVHLAVHGDRVVTRDALIEALWGPDPAPGTEAGLRSLLSRLRRVLGADAISNGEHPRLLLPPGAFVDLEAARAAPHRAEAAVAGGDWARGWAPARVALHTADRGFLPGHDGAWIDDVRRELHDIRLRALEAMARIGLGMGGAELPAAERSARRLVELAPFRESGHRLLMEALVARGNTAEAMLVYDRLRALLRDELGMAPSPAAQAIHQRLLSA